MYFNFFVQKSQNWNAKMRWKVLTKTWIQGFGSDSFSDFGQFSTMRKRRSGANQPVYWKRYFGGNDRFWWWWWWSANQSVSLKICVSCDNLFFENEFTDIKYEISFEQYLVYNQLCQLSQHMSQKNINKQTQMASQIVKSDQEGGKYL